MTGAEPNVDENLSNASVTTQHRDTHQMFPDHQTRKNAKWIVAVSCGMLTTKSQPKKIPDHQKRKNAKRIVAVSCGMLTTKSQLPKKVTQFSSIMRQLLLTK